MTTPGTPPGSPGHSDGIGEPAAPGALAATTALEGLGARLGLIDLPYALPGAAEAAARAALVADQLGDYILPRLASIDAPLLAVVGGSTGAGKSTLVSSLIRRRVAAASAIRPTTRRPLLLHAPADEPWFASERVLGSLARVRVPEDAPPSAPVAPDDGGAPVSWRELEVRSCRELPPGLALLDAPDVDSVVDENRELAATLLASADLWVFVTTAARYADAVPWQHLRAAAERDIVVAVVLDRVPDGATADVEADLRRRLASAGLATAPVITIPETALDAEGLLPDPLIAPLRDWLTTLAADAEARRGVARRTLTGALGAALAQIELLADELDAQAQERHELAEAALTAHAEAARRISAACADGSMLRGEVLARWQEYIGASGMLKGLETHVGRVRDRLSAALRGRPGPAQRVEDAIESSLATLIVAEAQRASIATERAWQRAGTAAPALETARAALPGQEALTERATALVHEWQGELLGLVRAEGADKRLTARLISLGVNGVGVALMIVVFAHTGGLTGGEVGIAGGTALIAQRLLEAIFGDQAMRAMAERAQIDLDARVHALVNEQATALVSALRQPSPTGPELRRAARTAASALEATSGVTGEGRS
ncbi:dynamin family protein [Actinomyces sp. zg328]|uniref:dynamin family protein n=1 Tax=Actinomyces sp. zg328 TaxID=2609287 RepID=UPI001359DF50|nr:dynamin family protein [Actinomyces sp. zg328]